MGEVLLPPRKGTNKITLEGYNHLTWRYKIIPYIRTDNCIDMSNMFSGGNYSLPETLDLRAFNTSKVTTMKEMFDHCMSTTILGLENFDTSKVTDMSFMFNEAKATNVSAANFDTSKVTTMENMFCNCPTTELDVSGFDTHLVTNMSHMFKNVPSELDVSSFDTHLVTTMNTMFQGTSGHVFDLSNFDTSRVTDMGYMFENAKYDTIDLSSFDTSQVTDMGYMFSKLSLGELDISNFNTSNVENMQNMFWGATLNSLVPPQELDLSKVTNIYYMFNSLRIPSLDLRDWNFPAVTLRRYLFSGLKTNTLDLSTWNLGEHVSENACGQYVEEPSYLRYVSGTLEGLFSSANIENLIFSNNNTFPEYYNADAMFGYFHTNGTLDLSSFHFNKAYVSKSNYMFREAKINTLILPDINENAFNTNNSSDGLRLFYNTAVELLDMSNATFSGLTRTSLFNGLIATRINMPNFIPPRPPEDTYYNSSDYYYYYYGGNAKYVDYSAVNTIGANYTDIQYQALSRFCVQNAKIVWIPSTFKLNGNYNMLLLGKQVYTDAANSDELGWSVRMNGSFIHYNSTHEDFEQAILNDNPHEWVAPSGAPIFFCHTHVPLGTQMTKYQFNLDTYTNVTLDGEVIDIDDYLFDEVGEHELKITFGNYDFYQTVYVDDHGSIDYSISVDTTVVQDYKWNSSNRRYDTTKSEKLSFRAYSDGYLFIYPKARITNTESGWTVINGCPITKTKLTKISGVPFNLSKLMLQGCTQLTDISELIVCTNGNNGFDPYQMFYGCSALEDVSSVSKWSITMYYSIRMNGYSGNYTSGYHQPTHMFSYTPIRSAPTIDIPSGTYMMFHNCSNLTDISKLGNFIGGSDSNYSYNDYYAYFSSIFSECSSLSNVDRIYTMFDSYVKNHNCNRGLSLPYMFKGTAITNTDFIPEGLPIYSLEGIFNNCTQLTDLTGIGKVRWVTYSDYPYYTLNYAFSNIPATDYSPLANWNWHGKQIDFSTCKFSNISFIENWDLSKCYGYNFGNCTNLTSISPLSGKINLTKEIDTLNFYGCSSLTSLDGLQGVTCTSFSCSHCSSLTSLNGLQGSIFKLSYINDVFSNCTSLTDISALAEVDFQLNVDGIGNMFSGCTALTNLNGLQNLDVSNMTYLSSTFSGCTALTDISAIAGWNPYQVKNIGGLFYNCTSITSFAALSNWITGQLTNARMAFKNCSSLQNLNGINGINIGQCTNLDELFMGCTNLTDISGIMLWYTGACTSFVRMFANCINLTSVAPIRYWQMTAATNITYMFDGDVSITDAEVLNDWTTYRVMTSVSRNYAFRNVPKPWPTWASRY